MNLPNRLRDAVADSPVYALARAAVETVRNERELRTWALSGGDGPPPHLVKQGTLRSYAQRFGLRTLVETGTYLGTMTHAMRPFFDRIVTMEVDGALAARARARFARDRRVEVLHGDSAVLMRDVVARLEEPALFWLDGHFSGGMTGFGQSHCPVMQELPPIVASRYDHVILIDDTRCFGTDPAYPTVEEVRAAVLRARPDYMAEVAADIQRYARRPIEPGSA